MAKLKLGAIADDKPIKLTVDLPAAMGEGAQQLRLIELAP